MELLQTSFTFNPRKLLRNPSATLGSSPVRSKVLQALEIFRMTGSVLTGHHPIMSVRYAKRCA
jgi:hypothetical protein